MRITIAAVKSSKYCMFWVFVCSLSYPACAISYCRLWPARLYHIFSALSHKGTIFRINLLNKILSFDFLYNYCLKRHDFRIKLLNKNVCSDFLYNFCLKRHDFRIQFLNKKCVFWFSSQLFFLKCHDFRIKLLNKMYVLIFPTAFVWNCTIFGYNC